MKYLTFDVNDGKHDNLNATEIDANQEQRILNMLNGSLNGADQDFSPFKLNQLQKLGNLQLNDAIILNLRENLNGNGFSYTGASHAGSIPVSCTARGSNGCSWENEP